MYDYQLKFPRRRAKMYEAEMASATARVWAPNQATAHRAAHQLFSTVFRRPWEIDGDILVRRSRPNRMSPLQWELMLSAQAIDYSRDYQNL